MGRVVVLGNGIAGNEAAITAKNLDPKAQVVIVSKENYPLYSACVLADYVAGEVSREKVFLQSRDQYVRKGIDLYLSKEVKSLSLKDKILFFEDDKLDYDRLVIATGGSPFIPPIPGSDKEGVLTLKTFDDAERIKRVKGNKAVVIGSGPVGIEIAIALQRLGWSVTIVELLDRILPRIFDPPISELLKKSMETKGIQVLTSEKVVEIQGETKVESVMTDQQVIEADIVVMTIGMKPENAVAKNAGLEIGASGGIWTDEWMESSQKGVWACGDCAESIDMVSGKRGLYMLWNNAKLQGRIAGSNAVGIKKRYPGSLNITTVNVFNECAASIGDLYSDFPAGEAQFLHKKRTWGIYWLVFKENHLIGVQAMGQTNKVGALIGFILREQNLKKIMEDIHDAGVKDTDVWTLHGIQKDLLSL